VQSTDESGPDPISWWRFLLMTALFTCIYFGCRAIVTPPRTHPALLLLTILLGAVLGMLVAKWEMAIRSDRLGPRRGHRRSASQARWYLFGLAGTGLALSQVLPSASLEWLALGMTGVTTGAAGHAWWKMRRSPALRPT
jgi:hypothetical protein